MRRAEQLQKQRQPSHSQRCEWCVHTSNKEMEKKGAPARFQQLLQARTLQNVARQRGQAACVAATSWQTPHVRLCVSASSSTYV
jgi:hypothetical protein